MRFDLQEYLQDLKTICAIDSGRGNSEGNHAVAAFFESRYKALGLKTELRHQEGGEASPILLVRNSEEEDIDVLFIAHMDTVFADGTAAEWPLTVDDDGIGHGPGCVDCKGGCLSVYYLLREMLAEGTCNFRFCVAMNSDEERGSLLSRATFEELAPHTKVCLVFEPGRAKDEFVGCRKGGVNYLVKCHGIAAHSGVDPEKGASAILELSHWIPEFYKLTDYAGGTTINVGRFNGGSDGGSVADYAECTLSLRFLDSKAHEDLRAIFTRMREQPFDARTSVEFIQKPVRPALVPHAKTEELFAVLRQAGAELNQPVELLTTGGASDGNWVSHFGVATLDGCGPCGASLHTRNEYLKTGSVGPRLEIMELLLKKLYP